MLPMRADIWATPCRDCGADITAENTDMNKVDTRHQQASFPDQQPDMHRL